MSRSRATEDMMTQWVRVPFKDIVIAIATEEDLNDNVVMLFSPAETAHFFATVTAMQEDALRKLLCRGKHHDRLSVSPRIAEMLRRKLQEK